MVRRNQAGVGATWMTKAKHRLEWKSLVSTYAQKLAAEGAASVGEAHLPSAETVTNI